MNDKDLDDRSLDYSALHAEASETKTIGPNIEVSEAEQAEIVTICNTLKLSMREHARPKKEIMRKCYAYFKNIMPDGELLPLPASAGQEKSLDAQRPKVFYPLVKQQVKRLYSNIKLTLFPDDENYCRIKGCDAQSAQFDEALTEGFVYLLKEMKASEKIGAALLNAIWSGVGVGFPYIKRRTVWEWKAQQSDPLDPASPYEYVPYETELPPEIDIEAFNPIQFYLDPTTSDPEFCKWAYYTVKKTQELKDNPLFFNTDKLDLVQKQNVDKNIQNNSLTLEAYNGLNTIYRDSESNIDYDLYYFPYLKTSQREYRNMIVGIAGGMVVVRFHPNMFPRGVNPAVFFTWMPDVDSLYGTGPVEDIKDLQRLINILANYKIEQMARNGNRAVIAPNVDITNAHGIAGGYMVADNPVGDVVFTHMDFSEIAALDNSIAVLKGEAQMTGGSQDPFQGGANVDTKKTATEIQVLEGNSISISREVIEHISITGVEPLLERILYLLADVYDKPTQFRVDGKTGQTKYIEVDFSVIKNPAYRFKVEIVGTNPSQSKQAEVASLSELVQLITQNPQGYMAVIPVIKKIAELQGIKDIDQLLEDLKESINATLGIGAGPVATDGLGVGPQSPVGPVPEAALRAEEPIQGQAPGVL